MSNRDMNPTAPPLLGGGLLLLGFALPFASGCYQYSPVASQSLPANADVRARLSDAEIERLGFREIVPIEERTFEGKVLQNGPDTLALLVHVTSAQDWGFRDREINQRLSIPWNSILELELKELSRGKTGIVAGFGVALLTLLVVDNVTGFFGGRGAETPDLVKDGL